MNEPPVPGSWLACPRCEHAPLAQAQDEYRCDASGAAFPLVGGIPWLFAEPEVSLGEWRGRVDTALQARRHEHSRLATASQDRGSSALTRRRLQRLADATRSQNLMPHEQAEATIRSLLARMYQSSSGT